MVLLHLRFFLERLRRRAPMVLALLLLLPGLAGMGCRNDPGAEPPRHILLITLDALRADHLGCYGYDRPTSPAMDGLAAEGVLFSRAQVPRGQTWPSLTSMLTGHYPLQHGVRSNSNYPGENLKMLPRYLQQSGYRTGAFLANFGDAIRSKDAIGLDHLNRADVSSSSPQDQWDDDMTDKAVNWITENRGRATFTWVHLMNPHRPYDPPAAEYRLLFPDDDYDGWLGDRVSLSDLNRGIREGTIPASEAQFDEFVHASYWKPWLGRTYLELMQNQAWHLTLDQLLDFIVLQRLNLSDEDLAYILSRYDAEIRAADRCVGRLLETVNKLGLQDDTLVILSSDHGDELYDHYHYFFHSASIYEGVLHVPLVLRWPGRIRPATTVDGLVEITDLLPTILDAARVPLPADLSGRNLLPLLGAEPEAPDSFAFAEVAHRPPKGQQIHPPLDGAYSVRNARWKLVLNPSGHHPLKVPYACLPDRSFPITREELYDLQRDPREKQNLLALGAEDLEKAALAAVEGEVLDAAEYLLEASLACGNLTGELAGWFERHEGFAGADTANQVSEEVRRRLAALGYVDGEPLPPAPPALAEALSGHERLIRTALQLIRTAPHPGEQGEDARAHRLAREAETQLEELRSDSPPGS